MRYFKYLAIIIVIIFIPGCDSLDEMDVNTIKYDLMIDKIIEEDIYVNLDKDAKKIAREDEKSDNSSVSIEYSLLKEKQNPIFGKEDIIYNKSIKDSSNGVRVILNYKYIEDDFLYNNYIMSCFEYYDINSTDNLLTIKLSGKFYCFNNNNIDNIDINIKTKFNVVDSNGQKDNDNYKWQINRSNYNNVDIMYSITRDFKDMVKDSSEINKTNTNYIIGLIKLFGLIVLGIVLIILYKKYNKKNKEL